MTPKDWRMPTMCDNCPFQRTGPGARLRRTLHPGRMTEIRASLRGGGAFFCHKTTDLDDDTHVGPRAKVCAGALAYQEARGVSSNYQRVCEALEAFSKRRTG